MNDQGQSSSAPKPRRRWLQYSLRTLLLLMVPVAIGFTWLGYEYRKGQRQKAAIAWVEDMGGKIYYYDEATQNNWRRQWFGERIPERVKAVSLESVPNFGIVVRVSDIRHLADLENVQKIYLNYTHVTDLMPLAELENLQYLDLSCTQVSPEQVQSLQERCRLVGFTARSYFSLPGDVASPPHRQDNTAMIAEASLNAAPKPRRR